ncbi:hypothetical protein [Baekduia sp.]|jgi:hypothetical protein|uniref:hypothetical protein n=1 Tax=Baekduia sp. TaxID=2600305 RepID=UPI002DF803F1|nr:hypothetical protein [Baekduia sp.]
MRWSGRDLVSVVLSLLAALATVAAIFAVYLRAEIADRDAFADRAVTALEEPAVRQVVARQVVVGVLERGQPDLLSARPLLESVVQTVVGTGPFRSIVRTAALQGHHVLFDRGDAFVLNLADTGTVVLSGVRSLAPNVAARLPEHADATLIDLRERPFADDTLNAADRLRHWSILLPALALVLLISALVTASDRGRALARYGLTVGVVATVAAIALSTARTIVIGSVDGTNEIPTDDVRAAVGGVWDAFLGDLAGLLLIGAVVGFLLAAGILSALDPGAVRRRLEQLARRPETPWALGLRGAAIGVLGVAVLLFPSLALRAIAYMLGAGLVLVGSTELLTALGRSPSAAPQGTATPSRAVRRRVAVAAATALITVLAASGAAALVLHDDSPVRAAITPTAGCNGLPQLCNRRLNEVLFPGTHNAMAAADVAGWSLPNQRRSVGRQLTDGIRLFLLDPHYGRTLRGGRVQTDFDDENRDANKVARELSPAAIAALDRLGVSLSRSGNARGPREVWLCHTVCELGATRFTDTLKTMRTYLRANPSTVLVLILESYVTDADLQRSFDETDTAQYAATLRHDQPLPTLGELIASGHRLVVFTEKTPSGTVPWLNDAFSWIQDTPLGAQQPGQLQCKRYRGTASSPFLMLNHWIDRFPPPASANGAILTRAFLRKRIAECEKARGMPVSLIATDFYEQGALMEVADEVNRAR